VATEHRFTRVDGQIYSSILTYDRIWRRYLEVFKQVRVLARIEAAEQAIGQQPAGGPGVDWLPVPHFVGPWQYARHRGAVRQAVAEAADAGESFMLRVPGTLSTLLWNELRRRRHPYGVEVGADPYEVFAPGANRSLARPLFRRWFTRTLRTQCRDAAVAAYVTRDALPRRYPTRGWSCSYSDVELRESDYANEDQVQARLRRYLGKSATDDWVCLHIGTMAQAYKRQDALIRAVAECRRRGVPLRLRLVGSGRLEPELRALARNAGVGPHVDFVGQLPAGDAIRAVLDQADVLVLPSQTEGLPRVILEAMARGVPCLATDVGGLRELLEGSELFQVRDIPHVASKIEALVKDTGRLSRLVHLNIERAKAYGTEILRQRRRECYGRLALASRTSTAGNWAVEQRR
jgi:glycosyltransferase involved in cell wall biosynthesis